MTSATALPSPTPSAAALRDQRVFRALLKALSFPGRVAALPALPEAPPPLCPALAALLLGLLDRDVGLWLSPRLDCAPVRAFLALRAALRLADAPAAAAIAAIADPAELPALDAFDPGEAAFPERSATLLLRVPALTGGPAVALRGPGIETTIIVAPRGLPSAFWDAWADNHGRYPLGVDLVMTDGTGLLGLPRSVGAA